MFEFLNAPIACVIITLVMILIVEFKIILRKREVAELEVEYERYAFKDQERYQGSNEG